MKRTISFFFLSLLSVFILLTFTSCKQKEKVIEKPITHIPDEELQEKDSAVYKK